MKMMIKEDEDFFFFWSSLVTSQTRRDEGVGGRGGPHLKSPCWDLGELIRELEKRGGRPRQKSPRRLAAAWRSGASCHVAKLLLSPRGSGLIGSRVAYEPRRVTLTLPPSPVCLHTSSILSSEKVRRAAYR